MGQAKRLIGTAFLLAGCLYLVAVAAQAYAAWLLAHAGGAYAERAIWWDPHNSDAWTGKAREALHSARGFQPQSATQAYLHAARLNALDVRNWDGLAEAYFQLGDTGKAEAALRSAAFAFPQSPAAAWRLANFLLVSGRPDEAFPYLRVAARTGPDLRTPVFDLAWKALDDPQGVFDKVVPQDDPACLADYLRFLMARKKLAAGRQVWEALHRPDSAEFQRLGSDYAEALAGDGQGQAAAQVWKQVLSDSGREAARRDGNLITNGGFELDMPNAGLDWRFNHQSGYELGIDNMVAHDGTRSMRIVLDGTANLDSDLVWQRIPVRPNAGYRFKIFLKEENLTTDQGLIACLSPVSGGPEWFFRCTEGKTGTEDWRPRELDVRTGPNTSALVLRIRRNKSARIDNLIRGTVWLDEVSLAEGGRP